MDVRAFSAAAMQGLFGIETGLLEDAIFPGLDLAGTPKIIL
jgi:hypothetical protein